MSPSAMGANPVTVAPMHEPDAAEKKKEPIDTGLLRAGAEYKKLSKHVASDYRRLSDSVTELNNRTRAAGTALGSGALFYAVDTAARGLENLFRLHEGRIANSLLKNTPAVKVMKARSEAMGNVRKNILDMYNHIIEIRHGGVTRDNLPAVKDRVTQTRDSVQDFKATVEYRDPETGNITEEMEALFDFADNILDNLDRYDKLLDETAAGETAAAESMYREIPAEWNLEPFTGSAMPDTGEPAGADPDYENIGAPAYANVMADGINAREAINHLAGPDAVTPGDLSATQREIDIDTLANAIYRNMADGRGSGDITADLPMDDTEFDALFARHGPQDAPRVIAETCLARADQVDPDHGSLLRGNPTDLALAAAGRNNGPAVTRDSLASYGDRLLAVISEKQADNRAMVIGDSNSWQAFRKNEDGQWERRNTNNEALPFPESPAAFIERFMEAGGKPEQLEIIGYKDNPVSHYENLPNRV